MVQVTAAVKILTLVISASGGIARTGALVIPADVSKRPCHTVGLASDRTCHGLIGKVHPAGLAALVVDYHIHQHAGVVVVEGRDHVAQLTLSTEAGIVLQPIDGHITHALTDTVYVNATRVGNPYHIEVLSQLLSLIGQVCPLGGLKAVPIEALQHHTAVHSRPTLARNGVTAAIARNDTGAVAQVYSNRIGASGDTECNVNILAHRVQLNRLSQHRRSHPEVGTLICDRCQAVSGNAFPIFAVLSQFGRKREIAHVGILLAVLAIKSHLSAIQACGSILSHRYTHVGQPAVSIGLTQDKQVTRRLRSGNVALLVDKQIAVGQVHSELPSTSRNLESGLTLL